MKLQEVKIKPEDANMFHDMVNYLRDVFVLNHEEHFIDLGEYLEYFKNKYGQQVIQDIMDSDEVSSMLNSVVDI